MGKGMKTKSSAKKRLKVTATGKIVRRKPLKGHILSKKTRKRKRNLRKGTLVHSADMRRIRRVIPHAF